MTLRTTDLAVVRRFADNDPYVKNRLLKRFRVRPWNVIVRP
jgi:uncharacterized protein YciI